MFLVSEVPLYLHRPGRHPPHPPPPGPSPSPPKSGSISSTPSAPSSFRFLMLPDAGARDRTRRRVEEVRGAMAALRLQVSPFLLLYYSPA